MTTADRLRDARTAAGLTQSELARLTGVRQPSISAFESGRAEPRPETLGRLLHATRRRPSAILRARRAEVLAAAAARRAHDVRVFGSIARGEDTIDSDVDLVVAFDDDVSLLDAAGLRLDLEELLGVPVDVLSDQGTGAVRDRAVAEAVPL